MFVSKDAEKLHEEYKARGAAIRLPPTNYPWALERDIKQVIEVIDLIAIDFPLLLLDVSDKMPERLLVSISQR